MINRNIRIQGSPFHRTATGRPKANEFPAVSRSQARPRAPVIRARSLHHICGRRTSGDARLAVRLCVCASPSCPAAPPSSRGVLSLEQCVRLESKSKLLLLAQTEKSGLVVTPGLLFGGWRLVWWVVVCRRSLSPPPAFFSILPGPCAAQAGTSKNTRCQKKNRTSRRSVHDIFLKKLSSSSMTHVR